VSLPLRIVYTAPAGSRSTLSIATAIPTLSRSIGR
jgi:hypothetical protein